MHYCYVELVLYHLEIVEVAVDMVYNLFRHMETMELEIILGGITLMMILNLSLVETAAKCTSVVTIVTEWAMSVLSAQKVCLAQVFCNSGTIFYSQVERVLMVFVTKL